MRLMLFNSWQDETYGSPTFMAIPTQQLCTFVDKQLYTFSCVNSCMEQTIIHTLKNVLWWVGWWLMAGAGLF
jgi:hypothetical protein